MGLTSANREGQRRPKFRSGVHSLVGMRASLAVGGLAAVVFLPSLWNGFVYDDEQYVLANTLITSWSWRHLRAIITEPYFGNFHPLHLLTYAIERSLFGLRPVGWHAVSVALHAANIVLLCRLLLYFGISRAIALIGAAIFAVHPVQVESVAWVSEQKNLLSLLFTFLSLKCYLRNRETGSLLPLLGATIAFIAALASKVSAVGLVPFLIVLEYAPPPALPSPRGGVIVRFLPFLIAAGIWMNLAILAHGEAGFIHSYPGGSLSAAIITIGPVLMAYARNLLWPNHLSAAYDLPSAAEFNPVWLAGSWLLVGLGALVVVRIARHDEGRYTSLGLAWTAGFLAPVLNLVPIGTLMNDRYLYAVLCVIGPAIAWALCAVFKGTAGALQPRATFWIQSAVVTTMLAGLAVTAALRTPVWRDTKSLWVDAAAKCPRSALARYNLGTLWIELGRDDLAEPELRAALEADPSRPRPYQNLGAIYYRQGKYRLAETEFLAAAQLVPQSFSLWMRIAAAQAHAGRDPEAIASLKRASRLRPADGRPYFGLAILMERRGDEEQAVLAFRKFLASPDGNGVQRRTAEKRLHLLRLRNRNVSGPSTREDRSDGTQFALGDDHTPEAQRRVDE